MHLRKLGTGFAFVALVGQPLAASAQETCITKVEARMGITYLAPVLIDAAIRVCTPHLPRESGLLTLGPPLADSYRSLGSPSDGEMRSLLNKFSKTEGSEEAETPTLEEMKDGLVEEMAKDVQAEECAIAEKFALDMAALPPVNVLGLIENFIYIMELDERKQSAKSSRTPIKPSIFCS